MTPKEPATTGDELSSRKLPYEAPRILETEEFETLALACALQGGSACLRPPGNANS